MARSFGRKFLDFLWGPAEDAYADGYEMYEDDGPPDEAFDLVEDEPPARAARRSRPSPRGTEEIVELRPPRHPRTEVHFPRSFADAQMLADQFKSGCFLIVELEHVEEKDRAKIVHFLSGVAYGRDGISKKVNDLTFIFAPRHFEVEMDEPRQASSGSDLGFMPRFSMK